MKPWYHPTITAKLEEIRPKGDFVLIRRIDEPLSLQAPKGQLIVQPDMTLARSGEMRPRSDTAPRRGVVVAVGKGDRAFYLRCVSCEKDATRTESATNWKCRDCGGSLEPVQAPGLSISARCLMHVKPGDEVFYQFWANNVVTIQDVEYQFVHEQQGILAVIERDEDEITDEDLVGVPYSHA